MPLKFVTSSKMKTIDKQATQKFAIPSIILMENAGISVADEAEKMLIPPSQETTGFSPCRNAKYLGFGGMSLDVRGQKYKRDNPVNGGTSPGTTDFSQWCSKNKLSSIAIICGYGNNGGDGFVVARHLVNRGYKVNICLVGKSKKMSDDTKINFNILNKMKIKIIKINKQKQILALARVLKKTQLIIDAIFGIGIKGELDKFYCQLIQVINNSRAPILSIDIPSGLEADSGVALPLAVKARKTITMGLPKKGFLNPGARKYLGKVIIGDISLPRILL